MQSTGMRRVEWGITLFAVLVASVVAVGSILAQAPTKEGPATGSPAANSAAEGPGSKGDKKPAGRLPPYYGEVISKEQRAKIYEIQARYAELVVKLQQQIEMIEKQQQADVENVLTPDQRAQVAKRVAEAKAKRAKTGSESSSDGGKGG